MSIFNINNTSNKEYKSKHSRGQSHKIYKDIYLEPNKIIFKHQTNINSDDRQFLDQDIKFSIRQHDYESNNGSPDIDTDYGVQNIEGTTIFFINSIYDNPLIGDE